MSDIPLDWELYEEGGCPECGGDIFADSGCEGGGFSDGASAACNDCDCRGSISVAEDGEAWFSPCDPDDDDEDES